MNERARDATRHAHEWLSTHRNIDGSWGYRPGQPGSGEPTLLATAAGLPAPLPWLQQAELGWTRLMAPVCLRHQPTATAFCAELVNHIVSHRGTGGETAGTFDGNLPGWPWVEQTFSWVEPTAWAVLSLRHVDSGSVPETYQRIEGGLAVLADRQCTDGGWNAGTPDILGQELFGYLYLTGLVMVALPPGHRSVPPAQRFLAAVLDRPSPLNLSWAGLAAHAHGGGIPDDLVAALIDHQAADGGFAGRADRTALALNTLRVATGEVSALARGPMAPKPGDER